MQASCGLSAGCATCAALCMALDSTATGPQHLYPTVARLPARPAPPARSELTAIQATSGGAADDAAVEPKALSDWIDAALDASSALWEPGRKSCCCPLRQARRRGAAALLLLLPAPTACTPPPATPAGRVRRMHVGLLLRNRLRLQRRLGDSGRAGLGVPGPRCLLQRGWGWVARLRGDLQVRRRAGGQGRRGAARVHPGPGRLERRGAGRLQVRACARMVELLPTAQPTARLRCTTHPPTHPPTHSRRWLPWTAPPPTPPTARA